MANEKSISDSDVYRSSQPIVHDITATDLLDALSKGIDDFRAMPTHLINFCWIYPIVILIGARAYAGYDVLHLTFPLLAGYTLIGPLVATGMYELSRRREMGLDTSRWHAFEVVRSPSIRSIAFLGILLMVIYFAWLFAAQGIYRMYFGTAEPESILAFISQIFTTSAGWGLIIVGCSVGFIFAAVVFVMAGDRSVALLAFALYPFRCCSTGTSEPRRRWELRFAPFSRTPSPWPCGLSSSP